MSSQRPFFLSTFFAAFRASPPSALPSQQGTKHSTSQAQAAAASSSSQNPSTTTSASRHHHTHHHHASQSPSQRQQSSIASQLPYSPRGGSPGVPAGGIPIPGAGRRRGSDSSSEGFRDVRGADKWYIGGRTATGEEKFFKLGVVRRVKSGDRLSLDRLSL